MIEINNAEALTLAVEEAGRSGRGAMSSDRSPANLGRAASADSDSSAHPSRFMASKVPPPPPFRSGDFFCFADPLSVVRNVASLDQRFTFLKPSVPARCGWPRRSFRRLTQSC